MKLRKLLAGITAAALAVSAMAFSSLTASAEKGEGVTTPYAQLTLHSKSYAVKFTPGEEAPAAYSVKNLTSGENTLVFETTATNSDTFTEGLDQYDSGDLTLVVLCAEKDVSDVEFGSIAVNGTEKITKADATVEYNDWAWDGAKGASVGGYIVTVTKDKLKALGDVKEGDKVTVTAKATYTASAAQEPADTAFEADLTMQLFSQGKVNTWWGNTNGVTKEVGSEAVEFTETYKIPTAEEGDELVTVGYQLYGDEGVVGKTLSVKLTSVKLDNTETTAKLGEAKEYTLDTTKILPSINDLLGVAVAEAAGKTLSVTMEVKFVTKAASSNPTTDKEPEEDNTTASAPTVSSNKHQGVGMPPVVIDQKSAPAASAGETAAASGSTSVTLGDSTVVSKDVIDSVSGKDAEFKLSNGASWEIAAADAAKAEGMDLGITLNTTAATADQIKEVAKDNDTFQFSLAYSGDFGFSAVVNIPVDAKYNGKYANLYWLNGGKLEFIGSSKVEGGIADFTMKHASDYVIVFDDEAYGEDVSSGAGVYEAESETSSAPVAVVVTFAALAVSAVILKKRVF